MSEVLKQLSPILEKFGEWVEANPELVKNIVIFGGAIS